jgi:hypothetical protein
LKAKVRKQGNVLGALFALGQLGEHEEALEAFAGAKANALQARS